MLKKLNLNSYLLFSKSFSLIEVLVTSAILSVCIVVLFNTFSVSIRTTRTVQDYIRAKFLLQNKLNEIEISGIEEDVESDFNSFSDPFSNFKWKLEVDDKRIEKINLNEITLIVQLPDRSNNREIKATTYIFP